MVKRVLQNTLLQVLFHVIGRDWDDHITLRRLPCVRLHASSGLLHHITSTCSLTQAPGLCLARLNLPGTWFKLQSDQPHPFTLAYELRVKAKRGLELLELVGRDPDWLVASEIRHGGKESVAIATVSQNTVRSTVPAPQEVLHVSLKVGNVTGETVTRRLVWHIEPTTQEGHRLEPERLVVQLAVTSSSLQAIIPVPMDDELVNTAVLTGRTVAVPLRIVTVSAKGPREGESLQDVTARASCQSFQPDVIQVSKLCDYLYVSGREERGGVTQIGFSYGPLTSNLSIKVWWPDLPLQVHLLPSQLSPIKAWLAPSLSHARSVEQNMNRWKSGCFKRISQNAEVRILTQFILKDVNAEDEWTTMFGRNWLVDVSDLLVREVKARDPDVAQVHDGNLVVGLSPGNTSIQVLSPLSGKVLGASPLTVLSIPVVPVQLRLLPIGKIYLDIDPTSGGNSTFVATVTADTIYVSQDGILAIWIEFSDGSTSPLHSFSPSSYILSASSSDPSVIITRSGSGIFPTSLHAVDNGSAYVEVKLWRPTSCEAHPTDGVVITAGKVKVSARLVRLSTTQEATELSKTRNPTTQQTIISETSLLEVPGIQGDGNLTEVIPDSLDHRDVGFEHIQPARDSWEEHPTHFSEQEIVPSSKPSLSPSNLELGLYASLAVLCLAILAFLLNCTVMLVRRRQKYQDNGDTTITRQDSFTAMVQNSTEPSSPGANSQWLHANPCLSRILSGSLAQEPDTEHSSISPGCTGQPRPSPTSCRKQVQFTTFGGDTSSVKVTEVMGNNPVDLKNELEFVKRDPRTLEFSGCDVMLDE
uniref:Transmembrane protein 132D n=1 Tax=Eptatretus burgeri TaxID=7764 RepID=A0A8C4Q0S9_EPTBU